MNSNTALYKSVFLSPFKYLKPSIRSESNILLCLLLLQVLMLALTKSYSSLFLVFVCVTASFLADFASLFDINLDISSVKDSFFWTTSAIRGIIVSLLLPSIFPAPAAFFIVFFVFYLNKKILGGFAASWINPAALCVAIAWIVGIKFFPDSSASVVDFQTRNPALTFIQNGTFTQNSLDASVTSFFNKRIFSFFGVSIPSGYVSLLFDTHSVIPAFRFNLLTLISSIILIGYDFINPIIPSAFLAVYLLLVKFFAPLLYNGPLFQGDVILASLTSGTLFCTFFMLQWHGTTPFTNRGKLVYAVLSGLVTFFIVGVGLSSIGFIFAILISNIHSLFIQSVENHFSKQFVDSVLKENLDSVLEGNNA